MTQTATTVEQLIADGAARLLARATENYALAPAALLARLRATLDKYLLMSEPAAAPQVISEFLDALHADDLCLVLACEANDNRAWEDLVSRFNPTVRSAARNAAGNEDAAEDLAQSIWAELYGLRTRADGKPAGKLGYYSGRGSLGGWLRAVVAQLAVDQYRKVARYVQTEDDRELDIAAQAAEENETAFGAQLETNNPELALDDKRTARALESAFAETLAALSPEDRLMVKLYYFDDLRLHQIGAMLGFHEATASRRLARLQTDLKKSVVKILRREHGWTETETARALENATQLLNTDVEKLLMGKK